MFCQGLCVITAGLNSAYARACVLSTQQVVVGRLSREFVIKFGLDHHDYCTQMAQTERWKGTIYLGHHTDGHVSTCITSLPATWMMRTFARQHCQRSTPWSLRGFLVQLSSILCTNRHICEGITKFWWWDKNKNQCPWDIHTNLNLAAKAWSASQPSTLLRITPSPASLRIVRISYGHWFLLYYPLAFHQSGNNSFDMLYYPLAFHQSGNNSFDMYNKYLLLGIMF